MEEGPEEEGPPADRRRDDLVMLAVSQKVKMLWVKLVIMSLFIDHKHLLLLIAAHVLLCIFSSSLHGLLYYSLHEFSPNKLSSQPN